MSSKPSKCACGKGGGTKSANDRASMLRVTTVEDAKREKRKKQWEEIKSIEAKVILLGDSGVGKSSIAHRYCHDQFTESHDVTIGGAYMQQTITLED